MLTLQIPTLLALLATGLMAVVIFAPERVAATPKISFAPPLAPVPLERWESPPEPYADFPAPPIRAEAPQRCAAAPQPPAWPALVDLRATGCDATTRLALVEALVAIRGSWADAILQTVVAEEPDPNVRAVALGAGEGRFDRGTG